MPMPKRPAQRDQKQQVLEQLMQDMQKKYGVAALHRAGELPQERERISTGIVDLDVCLRGGIPKGTIVQLSGPKQSGKTALALHIASQRMDVVYIDADGKLDEELLVHVGLTANNCVVVRPESLEQAFEMALTFCKAGVQMVVIDSLPSLVATKEASEKHFDKQAGMAMTANFLSRKLGVVSNACYTSGSVLLVVNQKRANVNAVAFGEQWHDFGGHMLASLAAISIDLARVSWLKYDDKKLAPFGQEIAFLITKSSFSSPRVGGVLPQVFGEGILTYPQLKEAKQKLLPNAKLQGKASVQEEVAQVEAELEEMEQGNA